MNSLTPAQWQEVVRSQAATIESLQQRRAWFERQVFGSKSERLSVLENPQQLALAELALRCPPAPVGVLEGSRADVSFLAGLLVDKFAYHTPLYRQHQRLQDNGIRVTRPWLTQLTQQAIGLLEPVYDAQLASIRESRVIAMDETPIKAGRSGHGKMKTGYFWPIYGERAEVCFPFFSSRGSEHVRTVLGLMPEANRVLLTDGYAAYEKYAKKLDITHAQCWVHCEEAFLKPCRQTLRQWKRPSNRSPHSIASKIRSGTRT